MNRSEGIARDHSRLREDEGSAVLGWLLVFPLLMLMTFGAFQFILYSLAKEEVSNAAREGARRAALDGSTFSDGATLAKDFISEGVVLRGEATVTGERGPEQTTLTVTGTCKWLISADLFGDNCSISQTAVVPTEGFVEGIVAS